jgi:hypothetical protein
METSTQILHTVHSRILVRNKSSGWLRTELWAPSAWGSVRKSGFGCIESKVDPNQPDYTPVIHWISVLHGLYIGCTPLTDGWLSMTLRKTCVPSGVTQQGRWFRFAMAKNAQEPPTMTSNKKHGLSENFPLSQSSDQLWSTAKCEPYKQFCHFVSFCYDNPW